MATPCMEIIIAVFALLFSINFRPVLPVALRHGSRQALQSDELRFFLVVVGLSAPLVISINIRHLYPADLSSACATPSFRWPPSSPPPASPRADF
ncbi:MAG: hypothetical protein ACLRWQ_06940 [Flavonifractor plautii]